MENLQYFKNRAVCVTALPVAILSFRKMLLRLITLLPKQSVISLGIKCSKENLLRHKTVPTFEKLGL